MKIKPLLVSLGVAAALTPYAQAQVTIDIHVYDFDFGTAGHVASDPTIHPGDTVHWIWDASNHSTTSAAGQAESWNSGIQPAGSTFDHTFTQLGTFEYYCLIHGADLGGGQVSGMSGSITVAPVPEPGAWGLVAGSMLLGYSALRKRR